MPFAFRWRYSDFFTEQGNYNDMQFLGIASNPPWQGERKQSFGLNAMAECRCKCCKAVGGVLDCAVRPVLQKPPLDFNMCMCFVSAAATLL